jgi:hypothetical protein
MKLTQHQMDWIVAQTGYIQIAGIVLVASFFVLKIPLVFTGLACYWLGLLGSGFASWKTERGLWMLSAIFLIPTMFAYAWFLGKNVLPLVGLRQWMNWLSFDITLTSILFAYSLRFVLTSLIYNYRISKLVG